jgi:tetratricopeptide (TPR) repeat protein
VIAPALAKLCGYLPLALRVAASFLASRASRRIEDYLQQLGNERMRLERLRDPHDPELDVAASLQLSYDALEPAAQSVLCQLSVFPTTFSYEAAWHVVQLPPDADVDLLLDELCLLNLLDWDHTLKRYSLHDLVHAFATVRLKDGDAVRMRHATYYANVAAHAREMYQRGDESTLEGLALFDQERAHIDTGCQWVCQQGSSSDLGELLLHYAHTMTVLGDMRFGARHDRIPVLQRAVIAAQEFGQDDRVVRFLNALGSAYRNLGETEEAITHYKRALEITQRGDDQQQMAETLGNLGSAYRNLGLARQAIPYYEQAVALAQSTGNWHEEAINLGNLGTAYDFMWEPRRAIPYHEADIKIMREHHHRRGLATALSNLGMSYQGLGEIGRALDYYEQSLQIMREIRDRRGEGNVLGHFARAYTARGEPQRAVEALKERIALAREKGDRRGESAALGYLADAYTALGAVQQAIELCQEGLKLVGVTNDQRRRGRLLGSLGQAYAKLGAIDQAISAYEQHVVIAREIDDRLGEADSSWGLGMLMMQQGKLHRAIELMQVCVDRYRASGHVEAEARAIVVEQLRQGQSANGGLAL